MELFVDTLNKCGLHLLTKSDEEIGYSIFEEFDTGATSFLHRNALAKLIEADLITEEAAQKCAVLREKVMKLQGTKEWNICSVKYSNLWREVLELSDQIKSLCGYELLA
jgi:hypothetical protein